LLKSPPDTAPPASCRVLRRWPKLEEAGVAAPIVLWFDFASPYAYFALDAAERIAADHGRALLWRPFLLWAALKAQDAPAPMDLPAKRAYLLADMARSAAFYGLPYQAPSRFPLSAHRAARLYYTLAERDGALARAVGRDVFAAYFREDADISDPATLAAIAARRSVAAIDDEVGRRRLAQANDEAVAAGVYGSPWIEVDGESFFGADRLPQLAWRLSVEPT
jgi:2-hydroxychromene-2-carboxylate isomerase